MRPEQQLIGMSERERDSWRRRGEQYAAFVYVVTVKVCVCWGEGMGDEGVGMFIPSNGSLAYLW